VSEPRLRAALVVVSDRAAAGTRPDATEERLRPVVEARGFALLDSAVVPDEEPAIERALRDRVGRFDLLLTTGGTGVAPRDVTPEATRRVLEKELPGLCEEMRRAGAARNPKALGSRAVAGTAGRSLVVNLPGRPEGAVECFEAVAAVLPHLCDLLRGRAGDRSHEPGTPPGRAPGVDRGASPE
jgi:molybdenum cofactor synthesis domain-containing protein